HELGDASDRRGDDRRPARERLHDGQGRTFAPGRVDEEVDLAKKSGNLLGTSWAEMNDGLGRRGAKRAPVASHGARADRAEPRSAAAGPRAIERQEEILDPLLARQVADVEELERERVVATIAARRKLASCRILRMKRSGDAHRKHGHLVGIRPKLLDCDPPERAAHRKDEYRAAESGASEKADDRPPAERRQTGAMRPEAERQSGSSRDRRGDRPRGDDPVGEDTSRSKLLHDLGEATARREVETK